MTPRAEEQMPDTVPREDRTAGGLTTREWEVLRLIAQGETTKSIAKRLDRSDKTIEKHRQNLMRKLGIHNVAGLTRFALRRGLVGTDT